ncbi:ABC transporter permease [Nocardioides sp.]|uniref:ABC transporter permease n=1 Tax=Nocardioides sp. TaxID=35761 RepID=UPI002B26E77E|nr:FtsX-like permease family protein [Nocardioides sp.]
MIRAAFKSLLARKVRLVMSTFAIVLGVSFVVGTLIFSDTLNRSFLSLFAYTVGDVVVSPEGGDVPGDGGGAGTVPAELVDALAALPGAARADGQIGVTGVYVVDTDGRPLGGFGPPSFGGNWSDAPAGNGLQGLTIMEGREPEADDEVVLDAATADKSGWALGDAVPMITSDETANLEPTLVGIAGFPDGGSLNGATLAAFETSRAQELFLSGENAFNSVWVTAADGVSQAELLAEVEAVLPDGVEAVTGDEETDRQAEQLLEAISFLTIFLLIFAGISLVVGSFLIVNTFSILVAQRSRELALLRALGASRRQVTRSVQLEAFVLGVLGSTVGLGLGVLLAGALRALFANFGLDLSGQSTVYSPRTFIAAYAVGIVVTMVAAYLPARRTAKIAPVQAMRDDVALPESSLQARLWWGLALAAVGGLSLTEGLTDLLGLGNGAWFVGLGVLAVLLGVTAMAPVISRPYLEAARALFERFFGPIGNLAGQNTLRNPRRTAATASALMIGLTLACTMAIVGASAGATVDKQTEDTFSGDYVVSSIFGGSFSSSVADRLDAVDGVEAVVQQRFGFAEYDGGFAGIGATDPEDLDRLELTLATGAPDDLVLDTVLLGESFARSNDLALGDTLEIEVNAGTAEWTVAGTFEASALVQSGFLVSIETFEKAGYPAQDNFLVLYTDPGATGMQDRLDDALADQPIVTALDQEAFAAEQRAQIDQFVLFIYALLGLALLIAVLGIVNTLALSVIERTREVGLLRAIGVTRRQLRWMITLESVVISSLGAVLGVVLGIGFGLALLTAVRDEGLDVIAVPFGQVGVFLVLSIVIGVLASVLPARRAARLDVLEAISTE